MKKTGKKLVVMLICLVLVIGAMAVSALAADEEITTIEISGVEAPITSEQPSTSSNLIEGDRTKYAAYYGDEENDEWIRVSDGKVMTWYDEYEAGETYRLFFKVYAEDGYTFANAENIVLSVDASESCWVTKISEDGKILYGAADYVAIKAIERVLIYGVQLPVAGEKPVFDNELTTENDSEECYVDANIRWMDFTGDGSYLTENDTFKEKNMYYLELRLYANEGHCFIESAECQIYVMSGFDGTISRYAENMSYVDVYIPIRSVDADGLIEKVNISGVTAPIAGENAVVDVAELVESEKYNISDVSIYRKSDGSMVNEWDTYKAGESYEMRFFIRAKDYCGFSTAKPPVINVEGAESVRFVEYYSEHNGIVVEATFTAAAKSGDVNKDGDITNADLVMIARYIVNMYDEGSEEAKTIADLGDMDEDGKVTNTDLIAVARIIVGL